MRKINYVLTFMLMMVLSTIACNQSTKNASGFSVTGTVEGLSGNQLFFERISINGQTAILNEVTAKDDKLDIRLDTNPGTGYYRVRSGRNAVFFILDGKEKQIEIAGTYANFNNNFATVKGSALTDKFMNTMNAAKEGKVDVNSLGEQAKNEDPLVGAMILANVFSFRPEYVGMHEQISKNMTSKYPDLYLSKDYAGLVLQLQQQQAGAVAMEKIQVGKPAPDIAMPDTNGKIRKLSELKGTIVLIDFWASWCGPCLRSFPELTATYEKYKNKGFTVYSVSLDGIDERSAARYTDAASLQAAKESHKTKWIAAIEKNNLSWDYHVSELDKWDCKAAKNYGVESIPKTFLVDKKGNIAAINPRFNLEEAIEKVLAAE